MIYIDLSLSLLTFFSCHLCFSMRSIHRNLYSNITLIFSFISSFCFLLMDSVFLLKFPIVHYKHVFLKHSFTSCFKILSANSGFVILWSVSTWLSCLWGIGYFSYFFVCLVILDFYLVLCEWYIVHCECIYIYSGFFLFFRTSILFSSFSFSWAALRQPHTHEVQASTRDLRSLELGFLFLYFCGPPPHFLVAVSFSYHYYSLHSVKNQISKVWWGFTQGHFICPSVDFPSIFFCLSLFSCSFR